MAKNIERSATSAMEQRSHTWEYADAPESTDVVHLEDRYGLFVGGDFVDPKSGSYLTTIDPATEEPLAEVAEGNAEDIDLAVGAAREASKPWADLPPSERAKFVYRIARPPHERAPEV